MTARPHILFVDDEPMILAGLRNGLRRHAARWEMSFAESGELALAVIERAEIAVVISDMRMPGMDGAALLEAVRRHQPHAARLLLTGYAAPTEMEGAVWVCHQLLRKPCGIGTIVVALERACRLHAMLGRVSTSAAAVACLELADPPALYAAGARALECPELIFDALGAGLDGDPEACRRVLELCTPELGFERTYASAADAIAGLGVQTIGPLVLASHLWATVADGVTAASLRAAKIHGLQIARLAAQHEGPPATDAFLCGLVHGFGKLLLERHDPTGYAALVAQAHAAGVPIGALERERYGATHAELVACLLARWGVPLPIVDAVADHDVDATAGSLTAALRSAHTLDRAGRAT